MFMGSLDYHKVGNHFVTLPCYVYLSDLREHILPGYSISCMAFSFMNIISTLTGKNRSAEITAASSASVVLAMNRPKPGPQKKGAQSK